ncbi:MAG: hypothetical protein M3M88_04375 [Thermoproteota archaeon]|nr:hypothetical protein [Thermoproteota archaeon]
MGYRSSVSPQVVYNNGAIGSVVSDWETKIIRSLIIFLHFIIIETGQENADENSHESLFKVHHNKQCGFELLIKSYK